MICRYCEGEQDDKPREKTYMKRHLASQNIPQTPKLHDRDDRDIKGTRVAAAHCDPYPRQ
jgi:hypothetical protein